METIFPPFPALSLPRHAWVELLGDARGWLGAEPCSLSLPLEAPRMWWRSRAHVGPGGLVVPWGSCSWSVLGICPSVCPSCGHPPLPSPWLRRAASCVAGLYLLGQVKALNS